jgi:pimeloyl-ACP methyl ester carboxylesterase
MKYNFASGDPIGLPGLGLSRRDSLKVTAAGAMASLLPIAAQAAAPAKASSSKSKKESAVTNSAAIRPFHYEASKDELTDLKKRVTSTKWPDREQVPGDTQGVQLATMQKLAHYWETKHDWRKCEAKLFAHPHFLTEIDGLNIHFIHVRSRHEHALPIIITHGWPGSVIEQMKIIEPLTNPTAHGGTEADAFHVVIPSLPGYGFSGKPTKPGWNPVSIAKAWAALMQRLGYTKYVAQGGDWGNAISEVMALQQPPGLLGIHTNMAATVPPDVSKALSAGGPPPAGLSPEEKHAWDQLLDFYKNGLGYANEMSLRPQTLYGLADSPIGLAGWILDHDIRSYRMIVRVFDGQTEGLTRDDVLDNITLYWLTNTAVSSARLYWDTAHNLPPGGFFDVRGVKLPVGVSAFAEEIYQAPESWSKKAYVKLAYYGRHPIGTHFAAWEQPALFVSDVRATFKTVRS